jgi:hypothetical protein
MLCLTDYIGLRGCKLAEPESNIYINDLPGISLKSLDKIANEEQATFIEVWNTIQRRAITRLTTAVVNEFSKRYQLKTITEYVQLPDVINAATNQTAASAQYRGFTLRIGGDTWVSSLQVIHVQSLKLYLKSTVNTTVKFYKVEGTIATEVHSISVTGAVGWNNIPVNKNFAGVSKLFIGYDATSIESVEGKYTSDVDCDCVDCCGLNITPATVTAGTLATNTNLFGLSGIVSVKCTYDALVCANKSLFGTALWYLLGAEAMAERIYSDRINRYTTIQSDDARELRSEWEHRFVDELQAAMNGISLSLNDCCLNCNQQVTVVDNIP